MIYVGIDVAKDKHDCCIIGSDGEILASAFSFPNSRLGFNTLYEKIMSFCADISNAKVGLEATGHYHVNLLRFLLDSNFTCYVINPLHTNLYRHALSLRKTKTDKVDASSIAMMLITDKTLKPYKELSYHNDELKSLTRYRLDKVQERARLKLSITRLVGILFPELFGLVSTIHSTGIYALLEEYPGASFVAGAHLTRLKNLLHDTSQGRFGRNRAIEFRNAAESSVGIVFPAKSLELKHTIQLLRIVKDEIDEIERSIDEIMAVIDHPITTIPGIKNRMGSMILAEIGDFSRFKSPDQLLAYAGLAPSTYQSGQTTSSHSHMEKRGSKYLRYAIFNATCFVCRHEPTFKSYLAKKRSEGKHYYVAISHACKKLIRLIYHLQTTGEARVCKNVCK